MRFNALFTIFISIGNSSVRLNFNLNIKREIYTARAEKSILKLVKLKLGYQMLKNAENIYPCKICQFCIYFCVTSGNLHHFWRESSANFHTQ